MGQRRPSSAHGLRRHLRLLRRPRPTMAIQHADAQPGRCPFQHHQRAEWCCRQPILRLTALGPRPFQADHQQHQMGTVGDRHHSHCRHFRRRCRSTSTSCPSRAGTPTAHGRRTSRPSPCPPTTATAGASTPTPSARRDRTPSQEVRYVPGNENFQQGAFLKPGPGDPYVYSFGTPSGRSGSAYVARVLPRYVPDLRHYEYWNSDQNAWVPANPGAATPVIPGPVGEMSGQYNTYLKQYLMLYTNGANDVVARTAPAPQGPWSPEQLLVPSMQFPGGIYAPLPPSLVDG